MNGVPSTVYEALTPEPWQRECTILHDYRAPHQKDDRTRCVVYHPPSGRFLRHSAGPKTGTFWDVYGDDFLTESLALVELSKAPAPIMAISPARRQAILELPTVVIEGVRYVRRDALVHAVDGVIVIGP